MKLGLKSELTLEEERMSKENMSIDGVLLNLSPHYTNERFRTAQTIFGREEERLIYNYSDRLVEWDYERHKKAWKVAEDSEAKSKTARWYQEYLTAYFSKPIELRHILSGFNVSNGFPYNVFGYRYLEEAVE